MSARRHTRSRAVSSTATPRSTSRAYRSVREQQRGGRGLAQVASDAAEQCFAEARPAKGAHDDEPGRDVLRHLLEDLRRRLVTPLYAPQFAMAAVPRHIAKGGLGPHPSLARNNPDTYDPPCVTHHRRPA